jgi:hypothetical protein
MGSPSKFIQVPCWQSLHHQNRGELGLAQRLDDNLLRLSRHATILLGLFWVTCPPAEPCGKPAGLPYPDRIWKRCFRLMIHFPIAGSPMGPEHTPTR